MILVDTSIWVDHVRQANPRLILLLDRGDVLTHPMIIGELAVGNLPERDVFLTRLQRLFSTAVATDAEVLTFIQRNRLFGLGIGYVDCHLLAATMLTSGAILWSRDLRLSKIANRMGLTDGRFG